MLIVRDRLAGGRVVTSGTDSDRLRLLAATCEQYEVCPDLGAGSYYCNHEIVRNQPHPYDAGAQAALQQQFEQLKAAWLAGCNA